MEPADQRPPRLGQGNGLLALAIVTAAAILSFGGSDDAPRYQIAASGEAIVRLDTDSGALIACDLQGCTPIQPPDRAIPLNPFTNVVRKVESRVEAEQKASR